MMVQLASGIAVFGGTWLLLWKSLPRGGVPARFAGTEWEPYVAVAFCMGFALGFAMVVNSLLSAIGAG
jgi:hypothetical protein